MKNILKIVKSLEDSILLLEVSETIKNKAKERKGEFISMLLGIFGAVLLGNMLAGKGVVRAGEATVRVNFVSKRFSVKIFFLILPHPLTYFEMQMYYQNELRFNRVYSRAYLPYKIKNGEYAINLDEYSNIGTHWITLYLRNKTIRYFDSFGIEHITK